MKKVFIFLVSILLAVTNAFGADDPGFPGGDPDVPIDGGAIVLFIAGAYYGLKKIKERQARNS